MGADRQLPDIGDVVAGKYLVNEVLGRGGMGIVVGATHTKLDQRVAIKFLTEEAGEEMVERFHREARAAARLKSEHVARVHDVAELEDGTPYMVMEYLEGADLGRVVKQGGPLSVVDAVGYLLQACEGVAEAHSAGIVHRDLKPPNLFLARNPDGGTTLKVLDFGISKDRAFESLTNEEPELTKTSMVLGTPHYMSPEQMRSAKDVDVRADVWSLGAILYQLVTGERPFRGASFPELVVNVIQQDPPPPSSIRADVPPDIEQIIACCLSKERDDRYPSVYELARSLAPYGPPQSFARAERMARMLGLAPLSSAPGSSQPGLPPSSRTPSRQPSASGSRRHPSFPATPATPGGRGRKHSAPSWPSRVGMSSWPPDTEQEVGGPTEKDTRPPHSQVLGTYPSVDVVGLTMDMPSAPPMSSPAVPPGAAPRAGARTDSARPQATSDLSLQTGMTASRGISTLPAAPRRSSLPVFIGIGAAAFLIAAGAVVLWPHAAPVTSVAPAEPQRSDSAAPAAEPRDEPAVAETPETPRAAPQAPLRPRDPGGPEPQPSAAPAPEVDPTPQPPAAPHVSSAKPAPRPPEPKTSTSEKPPVPKVNPLDMELK